MGQVAGRLVTIPVFTASPAMVCRHDDLQSQWQKCVTCARSEQLCLCCVTAVVPVADFGLKFIFMDRFDAQQRSRIMSAVRSEDTQPERIVRSLTHNLGFRYSLHRKDLPGSPDLVFNSRRKVIFVHGCFWHQHTHCSRSKTPATRQDYWLPKLKANQVRDRRNTRQLHQLGWEVLIVWECELKNVDKLRMRLLSFLSPSA